MSYTLLPGDATNGNKQTALPSRSSRLDQNVSLKKYAIVKCQVKCLMAIEINKLVQLIDASFHTLFNLDV